MKAAIRRADDLPQGSCAGEDRDRAAVVAVQETLVTPGFE